MNHYDNHWIIIMTTYTQCRRTSPNVTVNCHSRMELRPPTARKGHPNFFAHCKRSTKFKNYNPKLTKHHENANRLNSFKLGEIINETIYFDIKTPCGRMMHVCFGFW